MAFAKRVCSYLVLAWNTLVDLALFVAIILFSREPHTVFKPAGSGVLHPHNRRFVHRSLSLEDVLFIKNTINCVSTT
jgi:hypothetical protein